MKTCVGIIGFLMVAIVVTLLLYKKRVAAEQKAVLEQKTIEIRNTVASILALGGICSQTDADGWQEYRCYDWGDVIKCYIKNIDNHQNILAICPIPFFIFGPGETDTIKRIVDNILVDDNIIEAEIVFYPDAYAYPRACPCAPCSCVEICIDMSDVVFAQPYYHRLSECIDHVYYSVESCLSETYVAH